MYIWEITRKTELTPPNGPSHPFIYHHLKTKDGNLIGGGELWKVARKSTVNRSMAVMQILIGAFFIDKILL